MPFLFARPSGRGNVRCDSNLRDVALLAGMVAESRELRDSRGGDDVTARLKSRCQAAAQQAKLAEQIANPDDQALAAQLEASRSRRGQLREQRMKSLGEISQAQIKTNEVAAELDSLDRALKDTPAKMASLEAELKQELAKRIEDTRLPVQRGTDKREIPLLLRAGRLHSVYLPRPALTLTLSQREREIIAGRGGRAASRLGERRRLFGGVRMARLVFSVPPTQGGARRPELRVPPRADDRGPESLSRRPVQVEAEGSVTVGQLQEQCPTVGIDLIRRFLRDQKRAGKLECLGRGPMASWRRR